MLASRLIDLTPDLWVRVVGVRCCDVTECALGEVLRAAQLSGHRGGAARQEWDEHRGKREMVGNARGHQIRPFPW